jgi:hypothetical protein
VGARSAGHEAPTKGTSTYCSERALLGTRTAVGRATRPELTPTDPLLIMELWASRGVRTDRLMRGRSTLEISTFAFLSDQIGPTALAAKLAVSKG